MPPPPEDGGAANKLFFAVRLVSSVTRAIRRPSRATLLAASIGMLAASWGSRQLGNSVVPGGVVDETAHALTTLLVLWAVGPSASDRFLAPAVVASVAIDVDHVPGRLGVHSLDAGAPRPYTHSLAAIALVLVAALLYRRRRDLLVGVAIGLVSHLWWDAAGSEGGGVPLLWPFSYRGFTVPYLSYLIVMTAVVGTVASRIRFRRAAANYASTVPYQPPSN